MKKLILLILFIPSIIYSQVPDGTSGVIRLWHFDESSGTVAGDTAGADTITWTGATTGVTGKFGKAVQTTAYTDHGDTSNLNFMGVDGLSEFSVTFWIYLTEIPANGVNGEIALFDNWDGSDRSISGQYLHNHAGGRWELAIAGVTTADFTGTAISTGNWNHIGFTFKKNDKIHLFINAVDVANTATANANVADTNQIGQILNNWNGPNYGGKAIYDDYVFWNKALTQSEIDAVVIGAFEYVVGIPKIELWIDEE